MSDEKPLTKIKRLPRNPDGTFKRSFIANGTKYTIRSSEDGVGIVRYTELVKRSGTLAFGTNFQTTIDFYKKLREDLNEVVRGKGDIFSIVLNIQNMMEGVVVASKQKYEYAFYFASLFVTREGEDLRYWNSDLAEDKINDWVEEGLSETDFLTLALLEVPGYLKEYRIFEQSKSRRQKDDSQKTYPEK
jgi:hypothetical protein